MVVRYEMTAGAVANAYWYRWRRSTSFKAGVFAFGLAPALLVFSLAAALTPRRLWVAAIIALIVEALSPVLFAWFLPRLSRRGRRVLMIDADGLTTEVPSGQWQESWVNVRDVAATPEFIFILGRGINSVSVPVTAFADDAEREEFVRRARRYLAAATP